MSEDQSIPKPSESLEDAKLASLNDQKSSGLPQTIGYIAIVISVILGGLYLVRYSGGFDRDTYLESNSIIEEMAALGGSSGAGGEVVEVAFDPIKEGQKIYQTNCMACHQVTGQGLPGAFPPLAESEWVAKDPALLARIILGGLQGPITVKGNQYNSIMAPLGAVLSDDQIAHVLTYIRQEWGNASGPVEPTVVAEARADMGTRGMWTVEELQPWITE
jgi:mono/diheme cytochrome c family protein